jgi:hypothetical protein
MGSRFVVLLAALLSAPAFAAGLGQKQLQGAPPPVTIEISVPYSFANVHQSLDHAVIRCTAQIGHMMGPVGAGQVTIPLNGQPRSGIARIKIEPAPGQRLSDAKHYTCGMQVSDGKMTIVPQLGGGPAWAKAQPGSTYMVEGPIN